MQMIKFKQSFYGVFVLTVLYACTPAIIVNTHNNNKILRIIEDFEPFAIVEEDTLDLSDAFYVGSIKFRDKGATYPCDFQTVKEIAKYQSRLAGANLLVITKHKKPDITSTCHRIDGKLYKSKNAYKYEDQIVWNENRPLEIRDYKASTDKRPGLASTMTGISYQVYPDLIMGRKSRLEIKTIFHCEYSYFKQSEKDSELLQIEQVHFDITEIYARKFRKKLMATNPTVKTIANNQFTFYEEIQKGVLDKIDEFDAAINEDPKQLEVWKDWVSSELKETLEFSWTEKRIRLLK